ncbi:methionine aminopeptidase, type II family protein [Cryptosporidium serpentis]
MKNKEICMNRSEAKIMRELEEYLTDLSIVNCSKYENVESKGIIGTEDGNENSIKELDQCEDGDISSSINNQINIIEKKKKKKKKKKTNNDLSVYGAKDEKLPDLQIHSIPKQENIHLRKINSWEAIEGSLQTFPPSIPVDRIYDKFAYPEGEIMDYNGINSYRISSEEKKELERLYYVDYAAARRAAEVHRQVRRYIQSIIKPGMKLVDLCNLLESKTKELVSANGLQSGWGFPTGCSLNNCAAHYTPNPGDDTILMQGDICKLDFGVQVEGRIIDCAFTIAFEEHFDPLVQATIDATNTGIKVAGVDVPFSEIGASTQEVIESYEFEFKGKLYPIKPIRNLNGHSISLYEIHGGKSVPIIATNDSTKMEENEFYAIETFASTGKGIVIEGPDCSHYMKCYDNFCLNKSQLRLKSAKTLLHTINTNFGTLAFCRRWLEQLGHTKHALPLKCLVDADIIRPYPPLYDSIGSYTSQMEHTILLRPTCKEVLSRGDDY